MLPRSMLTEVSASALWEAGGFHGHYLGSTLSMCPSGTNINDAMLLAVKMLDSSNQAELLPKGSVSLIILLTDGEPTEGEDTMAFWGMLDIEPGWNCFQTGYETWGREKGNPQDLFGSEVPEMSIEQIIPFSSSPQIHESRGDQSCKYPKECTGSHQQPVQPLLLGLWL